MPETKKLLDVGDILCARGSRMKRTGKGELSLVVNACQILTKSLLPLPEKHAGLVNTDKRYRWAALPRGPCPSARTPGAWGLQLELKL